MLDPDPGKSLDPSGPDPEVVCASLVVPACSFPCKKLVQLSTNYTGCKSHLKVVDNQETRKYTTALYLHDQTRALDPHSFFADPYPAVCLEADPDPALKN